MWTSFLSPNPEETDTAWKVDRGWVNSKISKLENFGYKVSERSFISRFVPVMKAL